MGLDYVLHESNLKGRAGTHRAVVVNSKTYTIEEVKQLMLTRNSTLGIEDLEAFWAGFKATLETIVEEGNGFSDELFAIEPSVRGLFDGADDSFTPDRHSVAIKMRPGPKLKQAAETVTPRKLTTRLPSPSIDAVRRAPAKEHDPALKPGLFIEILGGLLKFHPEVEDEGVFLTGADNASHRLADVLVNQNREILLMIPALDIPPGPVRLEVRARIRNGKGLRLGYHRRDLTWEG